MLERVQRLPLAVRSLVSGVLLLFCLTHLGEGREVDWTDYVLAAAAALYFFDTLVEAARTARARRRERRVSSSQRQV